MNTTAVKNTAAVNTIVWESCIGIDGGGGQNNVSISGKNFYFRKVFGKWILVSVDNIAPTEDDITLLTTVTLKNQGGFGSYGRDYDVLFPLDYPTVVDFIACGRQWEWSNKGITRGDLVSDNMEFLIDAPIGGCRTKIKMSYSEVLANTRQFSELLGIVWVSIKNPNSCHDWRFPFQNIGEGMWIIKSFDGSTNFGESFLEHLLETSVKEHFGVDKITFIACDKLWNWSAEGLQEVGSAENINILISSPFGMKSDFVCLPYKEVQKRMCSVC